MGLFSSERIRAENSSEERGYTALLQEHVVPSIDAADTKRLADALVGALTRFPDMTADVAGFCRTIAYDIAERWGMQGEALPEEESEKAQDMRNFAEALTYLASVENLGRTTAILGIRPEHHTDA